jgi:hypothetical protein
MISEKDKALRKSLIRQKVEARKDKEWKDDGKRREADESDHGVVGTGEG